MYSFYVIKKEQFIITPFPSCSGLLYVLYWCQTCRCRPQQRKYGWKYHLKNVYIKKPATNKTTIWQTILMLENAESLISPSSPSKLHLLLCHHTDTTVGSGFFLWVQWCVMFSMWPPFLQQNYKMFTALFCRLQGIQRFLRAGSATILQRHIKEAKVFFFLPPPPWENKSIIRKLLTNTKWWETKRDRTEKSTALVNAVWPPWSST